MAKIVKDAPISPPSRPLPGEDVSVEEAALLGSFTEDALSEKDAIEAAADSRLSPADALRPTVGRR